MNLDQVEVLEVAVVPEEQALVVQARPGKVIMVVQDDFKPEILAAAVAVAQVQWVEMPYHLKVEMVVLV
jgi:hypothetical protein